MKLASKTFSNLLVLSFLSASCCLPATAIVRLGDLGPLEMKFFAHQYDRETPTERLDRLEKLVFGTVQTGSIEERVAKISKTVDTAAPETQDALKASKPQASSKPVASSPASTSRQRDNSTSDYPRVSELERSLLGRTYVGEPVRQRLSRLETKAYGVPSRIDDLSVRVDKLTSYAGVYGMQPGDSTLTSSGNLHGLAGVDANAQSRSGGMLERVSAMELKIYGHPVTNRSLVQRIKDLETKVLGSSPTNPNEDMTTRVNQLWVSVNAGAGSQTGSLAGSPSAGSRQTAQTLQPFGAPNHSQQWSSAYAGKGNHNSHSGSQYSGGGQYNNSYNAGGNFNNGGSYSANSYTSNSYSSSPSSSDPNSSSPFSSNSSNNGYAPPFMANNSSSNNQFGKHKHKHSGQHGSFLGKIGKVVVFAGSAAVGASGLAVGAMSNMGGGYYGMGMGSGFGSPYSYATPSYSGFSNYGSVSSIGGFGSMSSSFGSPFGSAYSGSFSH